MKFKKLYICCFCFPKSTTPQTKQTHGGVSVSVELLLFTTLADIEWVQMQSLNFKIARLLLLLLPHTQGCSVIVAHCAYDFHC